VTACGVTTVICARNAARTIARAVASAASQSDRILLVDDFSSDDTVDRAREVASIDVISPSDHGPMGETRQCGLDAVATPYLVWLDADDEFLPGRVARLIDTLEQSGADLATDGVELVDGVTGRGRGIATIPEFVRRAPVRLFERMYLPGPGVPAARTSFARRIGYDVSLHRCEDVDFLLRAIAAGARLGMLGEVGYRLHAYPGSLSRDRDRQRDMYRHALGKHTYERVTALYAASRLDPIVTAWALVSIAMFRGHYDAALGFIAAADASAAGSDIVVEAEEPYPYRQEWRIAFARGTAQLLLGDTSAAASCLQRACDLMANAEALNNLGVACWRLGARLRARDCFEQALARRPEYADAQDNRVASEPSRITTHPLRVQAARQDYSVPTARTPDVTVP
jgi:glycosyltransferase involved in cell wall biosynthesis